MQSNLFPYAASSNIYWRNTEQDNLHSDDLGLDKIKGLKLDYTLQTNHMPGMTDRNDLVTLIYKLPVSQCIYKNKQNFSINNTGPYDLS